MDAVEVARVVVVPSVVDGCGTTTAGVVLLEMTLMLVLVVPEETVDDDTVECNDVLGSVDTSVIAAAASDNLSLSIVTLSLDTTDGNAGVVVVLAVLFLDVNVFEHGKQFEMT